MSTTTDTDLLRNCQEIAKQLTNIDDWQAIQVSNYGDDYEEDEHGTASAWLEDVLDIRFLVGRDKLFIAAEVLVAFGGPTIWVNFETNYVEGYWGGDEVKVPFEDSLGVKDALEEYWEAMA